MIKLTKAERRYIDAIREPLEALEKRFTRLEILHEKVPKRYRKLHDVAISIQILKDDLYRTELKISELMEYIDLDEFPENV